MSRTQRRTKPATEVATEARGCDGPSRDFNGSPGHPSAIAETSPTADARRQAERSRRRRTRRDRRSRPGRQRRAWRRRARRPLLAQGAATAATPIPATMPLRLEWRTPAELADNPANWQHHPEKQIAALLRRDLGSRVGRRVALQRTHEATDRRTCTEGDRIEARHVARSCSCRELVEERSGRSSRRWIRFRAWPRRIPKRLPR